MRRILGPVFLLAFMSCTPLYRVKMTANPCPGGASSNHLAPIVCIDHDTLIPSQQPVRLKSGHYVQFFITGGRGQLTVTFERGTPVDNVGHSNDHAWAHAQTVTKEEHHKYTIDVDGRKNDPEIVIEP